MIICATVHPPVPSPNSTAKSTAIGYASATINAAMASTNSPIDAMLT